MSQILKTLSSLGSSVWLSLLATAPAAVATADVSFQNTSKALDRFLKSKKRPAAQRQAAARKPAASQVSLPARPMTLSAQWSRVATVIEKANESHKRMCDLQAAAAQQLELAEYALDRLMDELACVMALPSSKAQPVASRVH
ncbi:MAG TPA: hypothetical protein VFV47_00850 [Hyphomicrobiaceae bacterium]|nr:hypothetical protein [Hyphomicrobiaceae bacterium]